MSYIIPFLVLISYLFNYIFAGCSAGQEILNIGDKLCLQFNLTGSHSGTNQIFGSYYFDLDLDQYTITVPDFSHFGDSFSQLPSLTMTASYLDHEGKMTTTSIIPIVNAGKWVDDSTVIFTIKEGKFVSFTVDPVQNRGCSDYRIKYDGYSFCAKQIKEDDEKPSFKLYIAFAGTDSHKHECKSIGKTFGRLDWLDIRSLFK